MWESRLDLGLVRLAPSRVRIHSRFAFLYKLSLLFQLDFFPRSRSLLTERALNEICLGHFRS
jgi:hypothetical protein